MRELTVKKPVITKKYMFFGIFLELTVLNYWNYRCGFVKQLHRGPSGHVPPEQKVAQEAAGASAGQP